VRWQPRVSPAPCARATSHAQMPATKAVAVAISGGLEYIKGSYGSPCAAWAHSQATGWY
jgi:hypothetical protein